jgi:hypothetical protein
MRTGWINAMLSWRSLFGAERKPSLPGFQGTGIRLSTGGIASLKVFEFPMQAFVPLAPDLKS